MNRRGYPEGRPTRAQVRLAAFVNSRREALRAEPSLGEIDRHCCCGGRSNAKRTMLRARRNNLIGE